MSVTDDKMQIDFSSSTILRGQKNWYKNLFLYVCFLTLTLRLESDDWGERAILLHVTITKGLSRNSNPSWSYLTKAITTGLKSDPRDVIFFKTWTIKLHIRLPICSRNPYSEQTTFKHVWSVQLSYLQSRKGSRNFLIHLHFRCVTSKPEDQSPCLCPQVLP